jgi:hypothetical protein
MVYWCFHGFLFSISQLLSAVLNLMRNGAAVYILQASMWLTVHLFCCYFVSGGHIWRLKVLRIMSSLYKNMRK